jgi:hypothetical protein
MELQAARRQLSIGAAEIWAKALNSHSVDCADRQRLPFQGAERSHANDPVGQPSLVKPNACDMETYEEAHRERAEQEVSRGEVASEEQVNQATLQEAADH